MPLLVEAAGIILVALLVAGVAIRLGMLIGTRLDRLLDRDEEEPRGPVG